jgi:hypothetical protein
VLGMVVLQRDDEAFLLDAVHHQSAGPTA